jgi:hypothetical protein
MRNENHQFYEKTNYFKKNIVEMRIDCKYINNLVQLLGG